MTVIVSQPYSSSSLEFLFPPFCNKLAIRLCFPGWCWTCSFPTFKNVYQPIHLLYLNVFTIQPKLTLSGCPPSLTVSWVWISSFAWRSRLLAKLFAVLSSLKAKRFWKKMGILQLPNVDSGSVSLSNNRLPAARKVRVTGWLEHRNYVEKETLGRPMPSLSWTVSCDLLCLGWMYFDRWNMSNAFCIPEAVIV